MGLQWPKDEVPSVWEAPRAAAEEDVSEWGEVSLMKHLVAESRRFSALEGLMKVPLEMGMN